MSGTLQLRRATSGDLAAIRALLSGEGLPTDGIAEAIEHFEVLEDGEGIVATAGVELHGECALLRSLVVAPEHRRRGLASRLVECMVEDARALERRDMYLLTIDTDGYFARLGFRRMSRGDAPTAILECRQCRELCPDTAVLMHRGI